jgi:hypothetical protein
MRYTCAITPTWHRHHQRINPDPAECYCTLNRPVRHDKGSGWQNPRLMESGELFYALINNQRKPACSVI